MYRIYQALITAGNLGESLQSLIKYTNNCVLDKLAECGSSFKLLSQIRAVLRLGNRLLKIAVCLFRVYQVVYSV